MDLELNHIPAGTICEGCLSVDRKLTTVLEEESRKFFSEILDPLDHVNHPLSLCWECTTMLKRVSKFKMQVREAHDLLVKYMLHQITHLNTLSHLIQTKSKHECYPNKLGNSLQNSIQPANLTDESQTLFVKIENDDEFGDLVGFYVDDLGENEEDNKEFETDVKTDPFQYEVPVANGTKLRSKRNKSKTKVEFDDSDDEPLTLKKQKETEDKTYKRRGRRKKSEDNGPKIDKRRHPAPKREKPSGVVNNSRVRRKLEQLNMDAGQLEMVVLSWDEVELERQRALTSEAFTRHQYRCHDCALGFNHKFKLTNHMKKHDPSMGASCCSVCRVRCRDKHALCAHRRRHRVRWRCRLCGGAWSRAAVAADHVSRAHGAPAPRHVCPTCGHTAATLGKLRNHLKNHAERQKCDLCGKTFRDRTSLRTHLFIHKGEKEYACPSCDKRFLFKKAMEVHMVTHDASAQLYCYQCDMNFKNRMSYYQHMKYNLKHIDPAKLKYACPLCDNTRRYACPLCDDSPQIRMSLCDKRFAKATRLEEHNLAVHLKSTPILCTVSGCSFACSSRPVLRAHNRSVHRAARARRNHVCHTCGKAYTTKKTLEGHIRSHTGERPFLCKHCPSTFGYEAALYNHNKLVHLKPKTGRTRAPPAPSAPAPLWQLSINPPTQPVHNSLTSDHIS